MTTFLIILACILGGLLLIAIIALVIVIRAFGGALNGLAKGFGAPDLWKKK